MRPPPGATPPQIERTSAPQADRSTNNSSRGRIGRSTMTVGAAAAAAAGAPAGAAVAGLPAALGAAGLGAAVLGVAAFGAPVSVAGLAFAAAGAAAAGASTARTALWQPDDRLDMFFCRHCSEASPPGGTLEQCAI